jgi:hypothetical protein
MTALFHTAGYDAAMANFDYHTWLHRDSLVVFAASNDGQRWGYGSLQPEAQGKNALAVGATRTAAAAREDFLKQITAESLLCPGGRMTQPTYERVRALVVLCGRTVPDPADNTTDIYPIGSWEYKVRC